MQVRPHVGETGDTAAARAAETLAGVDGVEEAAALDRKAREYARTKGVSYAEAVQYCIANP